jgi:hypothetical protein
MSLKNYCTALLAGLIAASISFSALGAEGQPAPANKKKKLYTEEQFLNACSNKSRKQITELLGKPAKKAQSVKPTNAESMVAKAGSVDNKKPVNVEMWYYNNLVTYDGKRTYKEAELTFVNDRVQNVGFFNNK